MITFAHTSPTLISFMTSTAKEDWNNSPSESLLIRAKRILWVVFTSSQKTNTYTTFFFSLFLQCRLFQRFHVGNLTLFLSYVGYAWEAQQSYSWYDLITFPALCAVIVYCLCVALSVTHVTPQGNFLTESDDTVDVFILRKTYRFIFISLPTPVSHRSSFCFTPEQY